MPVIILLFLFVLVSCGGGGGGGGGAAAPDLSGGGDSGGGSEEDVGGDEESSWSSTVTSSEADVYRTSEYNNQYGLEGIHAAEAYALLDKNNKTVAGNGVLVAIADTGARITHQDIADNINNSLNRNFNIYDDSDDVTDGHGHGTHVMTTAAGVKNDVGIHGVSFDATTFAIDMVESGMRSEYGIEYAANNGAKAVNMSWGYSAGSCDGTNDCGHSSLLSEMLSGKAADMIMVVATGNDADQRGDGGGKDGYLLYENPGAPAVFARHADLEGYVLAVGAVEQYNGGYRIADFSNNCGVAKEYCLTAPGVSIAAGYKDSDDSYASWNGTSMATPHVTGAVAVIRGAWTFLTAPQVSQILLDTATDLGDTGTDEVYGRGMLNLYAAVQAQGADNFSFGTTVSESSYTISNSSMTTSTIFGDAFQSNVLPSLSEAVFFDKYGRDYKANLASKVQSNISSASPSLTNIMLSNISYRDVPLNIGFDGKTKLNFNIANYKNSEVRNSTGLKYVLSDNSIDPQQQASSNNGFSFTQKNVIVPNSSFGFAFNIDEISKTQNKEFGGFGFLMSSNFAASPYQDFLQQSFGQDPQSSRKFNQFFAQKNFLDQKLGVNFSYQSSHESSDILGDTGAKQNQILDLGLTFRGENDSRFLVSTGSLKEFDGNMLNSKSEGAFSSGDGVETNYVKLTGSKKLTNNIQLIASISEGVSKIKGNNRGIFREFNDVRTRSSSVAIVHNNFFGGQFGATYMEPMRVYKGQVKFDIPVARDDAGNVTRYQGEASLASQGKERDFEIFYSRSLDDSARVRFNLLLQKEPANIKGAEDNHLGFVSYQRNF
jgi:subtilisin family serine protease